MSVFPRRPVRRARSGRFVLTLSDEERALVAQLAPQLREVLSGDSADPALRRLFPPAYSADADSGRAEEYDRLMRSDLVERHGDALEVLERTSSAGELTLEELDAWARALNQLRLVLGTRLEVTEDDTEVPDDPPHHLYVYLGYLQESVVEALSDAG